MKRTALFSLLALLFGVTGMRLGAEELRFLVIAVADFDFSGVSEGEMREYVDYLALQLEQSLFQQIRAQANPLYSKLTVSRALSGDQAPTTPPAAEDRALRLRVSGTLNKTTDGYALAISIADAAGSQAGETFEYAYSDVRQLYSDCGEVARRLAQACVNRPQEVGEYKPAFGAGVFIAGGYFFLPANHVWAEYTSYGLTGFVLPQMEWGFVFDLSWTKNSSAGNNWYLLGADLRVMLSFLASIGVDFAFFVEQGHFTPSLGFSIGILEMPPVMFYGWGLLKFTLRWDLATGKLSAMAGIFSAAIGISNLLVAGESFGYSAPRSR
jgi:hypothetical protein